MGPEMVTKQRENYTTLSIINLLVMVKIIQSCIITTAEQLLEGQAHV